MALGLLAISGPFFTQILVEDAFERRLINQHPALFMFERLQQEFFQLCLYHDHIPLPVVGEDCQTRGGSVSRSK